MDHNQHVIPFSTILASTIHDMKNALSLILQSLNEITENLSHLDPDSKKISLLQYQASRVNGSLVQLLALYKTENKQLPIAINYHCVFDFLEEQVIFHEALLKNKNINVQLAMDEDFEWAFDESLVGIVVGNVLMNTIRYTKSAIVIKAEILNEQLVIKILDDGIGYPEQMLEAQNNVILGINQSTGSTGLGLYFAAQVANMHSRNGINGTIKLSNAEDSGGIFSFFIP